MAKKDTKFGLFGGVFTPSVLTILGVIMYLRLPWVVGQAGLFATLGVILVAHLVSVATGLSISSIATDKKVGAGGPYYIVSRSLGLPIGGTLGLALFVGLCFSVSLYIIGFCESSLGVLGLEPTVSTIRIAGSITLVTLTVITFISTALAIKTQFFILGLIVLSIVSILLGSPEVVPESIQTSMAPDAPSLAVIFGIFFPAVTGFTAGVNMSGDLRDPKRAIPAGTMLAIGVGLAAYIGLAVFIAARIPREMLDDYDVLRKTAFFPPAVVAGIWGATLSSALGAILGAPRILQAVASDGLVPRIFAKGVGKGNEPRNALLFACTIGWAGIMIGELDAIARIVSMVFLATYGFLNAACAIESLVSPDFRPTFRIPRGVSWVGAAVCVLLMIELDLVAMAAATLVMGGLFVYLQRRQVRLQSGDAWEGVWTSLVKTGLNRLRRGERQQRNWRPNVLVFVRHEVDDRKALRGVATSLISGSGMATETEVYRPGEDRDADEEPIPEDVGFFRRELESADFYGSACAAIEHHGFGGLEPNTVLLDFAALSERSEGVPALIEQVAARDMNLLLFAPEPRTPPELGGDRIDVWWRPEAGNLSLCVALVRFVTRAPQWRSADVRFLLLSDEKTSADYLATETRLFLDDRRAGGTVRVVHSASGGADFDDRVRDESSEAELVILGLPPLDRGLSDEYLERLTRLASEVGNVLFFRASSSFTPVIRPARLSEPSGEITLESRPALEVPPLRLPAPSVLENAADAFAEHYEGLAAELDERGVSPLYERTVAAVAELRALIEKHFDTLEKRLATTNAGKYDNVVNRVQSAFLLDAERLLVEHRTIALPEQRGRLDARAEAYRSESLYRGARRFRVTRDPSDFEPSDDDDVYLAALKRRKRAAAMLTRGFGYQIDVGPLLRFYARHAEEHILEAALVRFATDSHAACVEVGKLVTMSRTSLGLLGERDDDEPEALASFVAAQREVALAQVDELSADLEERVARARSGLYADTRRLAQRYADDIDRIDFVRLQQRERWVSKQPGAYVERLESLAEDWLTAQTMLVERAEIGLKVSAFQHRLATSVLRTRESIAQELEAGVLSSIRNVCASLERWREAGGKGRPALSADLDDRFDPEPLVERFVRETTALSAGLPDTTTTLSDETIRELTLGRAEELETRRISARGVAELLIETELVSHVQRELEAVPAVEERAAVVARDAIRLVGFNLQDASELEPEAFAAQMEPVVETALERLRAEAKELTELAPRIDRILQDRLRTVIDGTNPYELTRSSDRLTRQLRRVGGSKAIHGMRGRLERYAARVRELMVYLLYRRSVGLLYARRLADRGVDEGAAVDRLVRFVESARPRPEVLEALPFFYRQLFLGQSAAHKSFWVERAPELERGRAAIARHAAGGHGALVVTGSRFAGKSAFVHRLAQQALGPQKVVWVHPTAAGSAEVGELTRALREATRLEGSLREIFGQLEDGTAVVFDDLELWWERRPGGLSALDAILDAIDREGKRLLFIVALGSSAHRLLERLRPLAGRALSVIECGPVSAEDLKAIIELRHGTTGLGFELDGKTEDELGPWATARLYSKHFDHVGGTVGAALRAWVASIVEVQDQSLVIELPQLRHPEVIDELEVEQKALLACLVLHKRRTRKALGRLTGLDAASLARDLGVLERSGLVVGERDGSLQIDPFVHHAVHERLLRGGLL